MDTQSLILKLPDGRRSIIDIAPGLLSDSQSWTSIATASQIAVVTNSTVGRLYAESLVNALPVQTDVIEIGDGEEFKSLDTYRDVIDQLIEKGHNRTTVLIALGGGVVGDLAGFVAATYQRGIRCIQVPTTLLAQVDSSVGGKTAVNHVRGKNLIGAFYQPERVIIDTDVLQSLPPKIFIEGLAEVIKYGVIADPEFFQWLCEHRQAILGFDQKAIVYAIRRSCETKADIVERDERESGLRAILNFGHTFAHGIETASGYGSVLHGEAVAIGMVVAAELSAKLGLCAATAAESVKDLVASFGLSTKLPSQLDIDQILSAMKLDKKVQDGKIRFVLMRGLGEVFVSDKVHMDDAKTALEEAQS